jgi:hypothetical protein
MKMKVIVKCSVAALMLLSAAGVYGQEGPTKPVKVDGTNDYYQNGYNSSGASPREERDSVTVTSQMRYFVLPDINVSPNWYDANKEIKSVTNTSDLNSTFSWTLKNTLGTTNSSTTPIVIINWGSTAGIDSIKVKETPKAGVPACEGKVTSIPVAVIPLPTITFTQVGTPLDYKDGACYKQSEVTAGISYPFPITVTSRSSQIKVDYSIVFTPLNGTAQLAIPVTDVAVTLSGGTGTIPISLQNGSNLYGSYEITITKITDRIARKSGVASTGSDLLTAGGSATFTYTVMKPVETGPIYRLPNNGNW